MNASGFLGELSALVGKCASCRHAAAAGDGRARASLVCMREHRGDWRGAVEAGEFVRPGWSCNAYDYEPGSLA